MSVRLMTIVYEAVFHDVEFEHQGTKKSGEAFTKKIKVVASSLKSICLALADHANDEGEGAYPSITKLERKTELSRPTVIACLKALKHQGTASYMGLSRLGTCNYTLSKEKLVEMASWAPQKRGKSGSKATLLGKATLPQVVKPLHQDGKATLLKPYINHTKPSVGADAPPADWGAGWQMAAGVEKIILPTEDEVLQARIKDAVGMFAPAYQELTKAFILATDIFPIKKDVANWQGAFKDQIERTGLSTEDVTDACKLMRKDTLTISTPHSIMNKIADIRAARKQKQSQKSATTQTVDTPFARAFERRITSDSVNS